MKQAFALESTEALLTRAREENKRLERERDVAAREAQESSVARCRAEDALAVAQKEAHAKNDTAIMLNLELQKLKAQKSEEDGQHRAILAELQQLKQESMGAKHSDERLAKEVAHLQDAVASLQTALDKEKSARASEKQDAMRAEEAHVAAARALSLERDAKESKVRKDLQEASEHIARLKNDVKHAEKDSHDRLINLQAEACSLADKLEQATHENKKLKERLDQSQSYIDILTNKQQQNRRQSVADVAAITGPAINTNATAAPEELRVHVKSLEHQHGVLQAQVASLKQKETDLVAQVKVLEKREADLSTALSNAEMRVDQRAHECKSLTLAVEQYKQAQRAIEQRAVRAEQALEDYRAASTLNVENALSSENKLAVEQRKLQGELERATKLHEIAVAKLQDELREVREERDGALDMVATFQLESEEQIERAARQLKEENAMLRQSAMALEHRNAEQAKQLRQLEEAMQRELRSNERSSASAVSQQEAAQQKNGAAALTEAHERLKKELQQVRVHLTEEVESMTVLLEQEMESHQSTRDQLGEARNKLALQEQTVAALKVRVEELLQQTGQLAAHARDASEGDRAKVAGLLAELQQQRSECESLRHLVEAKDQRLESMRLQLEALQESEAKVGQRHEDVRSRLDQLITQSHENERVIAGLKDAKRRLEERLDEHEADAKAQTSSLSSLLQETQEFSTELEAALKETVTKLEAEVARSASLQKRISALEIELAHAVEALRRTESCSRTALDEINEQLAAETRRLETLRDEAIREAERKIGSLTQDVEGLRRELSAQNERSRIASGDLTSQNEKLSQEVQRLREAQKEREAAAECADLKRTQAEAAAHAAIHRADVAEAEVRREREALAAALREVDMCRNMVAEAELASETLQLDLQEARRDAQGQLQREMEAMKERLEDAELKAEEAQLKMQHAEMQLEQSQREWLHERELLSQSLSSSESKKAQQQSELEARLFDTNRALFEAKNKLADLQGKHADAVSRLESAERKMEALNEEKRKREMNLQIQVDELEEELAECKSDAERAAEKLRLDMESRLQDERDKMRKVEEEAAEARHKALQGASELSQTESLYRAELGDVKQRYAMIKVELESKANAVEQLTQENVSLLQQLDSAKSEMQGLRLDYSQALATLKGGEEDAHRKELELERLTTALAESEASHYTQLLDAKERLATLQERVQLLERERADLQEAHRAALVELHQALQGAQEQCEQLKTQNAKESTHASTLDVALSDWRKRCQDLEEERQAARNDLASASKALQLSEQTAARKERELLADLSRANTAVAKLEQTLTTMQQDLDIARGDLSTAQERIAHHECAAKERAEDCSMLVQQLAESEIKVEELEATLGRVRAEREEMRLGREDSRAKAAALDAECQRLTRTLQGAETDLGKQKVALEDEVLSLRTALASEKERALTLANELRTVEARTKSLESSSSLSLESLNKQLKELQDAKDSLWDDNASLKAALEDAISKGVEEKSTLSQELRQLTLKLTERNDAFKQAEGRLLKLDEDMTLAKTQLADATEQLRLMRGIELKLVTAESKVDRMKQEAQQEVEALRSRVRLLEEHEGELVSTSAEWKHRCERAEQDQQLAQKERDRAKQDAKDMQARMLVLEGRVADSLVELNAVKTLLEEEKQSHARTQRGIVDQQKLIAQHAEKNGKLSTLIEEQKEKLERQQFRLSELECAGSQAMNVVSFQKEIERLTQDRDSTKALLLQKSNEHAKLSQMLISYEEKLRKLESSGGGTPVVASPAIATRGSSRTLEKELQTLKEERERLAKEAAEAKDWAAKYNNALVENKKLEKRLSSQETKTLFLKKKLEKLEKGSPSSSDE